MDGLTFREEIKKYMKDQNFNDAQMGDAVKCSESRIRQLKAGQIPSVVQGVDIALVCGLSIEETILWILGEKGRVITNQRLALDYRTRYTPQVYRVLAETKSRVLIAGITNLRKIRNCRAVFRKLVTRGGRIYVAAMDPTTESFRKRAVDESKGDGEGLVDGGLLTQRMLYEFYVTLESLKGLWYIANKERRGGEVEFRVFDIYHPPASLTIVDDQMAYRYVFRKGHAGEKKPVEVCWNFEDPLFREIEDQFWSIWKKGKRVGLDDFVKTSFALPKLKFLD